MLDYVINLLDDENDFSWASAKVSHVVLLCRMEEGKVAGWSYVDKTDPIRWTYAQRHISQQGAQNAKIRERITKILQRWSYVYITTKTLLCRRKFMKPKEFWHVCASCWEMDGKLYAHSQLDCHRLKAKNE